MKQKLFIIVTLLSVCLLSCDCILIVNDSSRLLSILNSLHYEYYPHPSGTLPITKDILIIGTITITSEELEVPDECSNIGYCRPLVGFEDNYGVEGISLTPLSFGEYPPCSLTLTNVMLRFRTLVINVGGPPPPPEIKYSKYPAIQLMPPSHYECDDSQIGCDVDRVCYDDHFSYCLHCLALSQEECVCQGKNEIFDDGTDCMVVTGDDTYSSGECQNGKCEPYDDIEKTCKEGCDTELEMCLLNCEDWDPGSVYICNDNCVSTYHYCTIACESKD